MSRTLYDKLVDAHTVCELEDGEILVYVDFHIMNEYTSPQAFSGLVSKGLEVRCPSAQLAVVDHVNATRSVEAPDAQSKLLIDNLEANCLTHDIAFYGLGDPRQGIEHIVVPEQGLVSPGMLIACGDSHTTTYGAYGALGFGIGTSEVEHVLASQTLRYRRMKNFRVTVEGALAPGVTAKDIVMKVVQIEDLRQAADILRGRKIAKTVNAIVVPGSAMTRRKAESEGLREVFESAGFEWRPEAGCSMCLAMNDDIAMDGERVASSTNRNFEGRQGRGARTHLMSPAMVAAAAIAGHLADVRDYT